MAYNNYDGSKKPYKKPENEVGAGWKKQGKNGEYVSIALNLDGKSYNLCMFKSMFKQNDKNPDYRIIISGTSANGADGKPNAEKPVTDTRQTEPIKKAAPAVVETPVQEEEPF